MNLGGGTDLPQCIAPPSVSVPHQRGTFITSNESALIQGRDPKSTVYLTVDCGCWTRHRFGQTYKDVYLPLQSMQGMFTALQREPLRTPHFLYWTCYFSARSFSTSREHFRGNESNNAFVDFLCVNKPKTSESFKPPQKINPPWPTYTLTSNSEPQLIYLLSPELCPPEGRTVKWYGMWPLQAGFFHLAACTSGCPMSLHDLRAHFFSELNSIPLPGCATMYFSVHHLPDILVAFTFGWWEVYCQHRCAEFFVWT